MRERELYLRKLRKRKKEEVGIENGKRKNDKTEIQSQIVKKL